LLIYSSSSTYLKRITISHFVTYFSFAIKDIIVDIENVEFCIAYNAENLKLELECWYHTYVYARQMVNFRRRNEIKGYFIDEGI